MVKRKTQKQSGGTLQSVPKKKVAADKRLGNKTMEQDLTKSPEAERPAQKPKKVQNKQENHPQKKETGKSKAVPTKANKSNATEKSTDKKNMPVRRSQRAKPTVNYNMNQKYATRVEPKKPTIPIKTVGFLHKSLTDKTPKAYQFKISMLYIEPLIWRRIQVPEEYHFGHLGEAIKSAMGWISFHNVHAFYVPRKDGGRDCIRRPDPFLPDRDQTDERNVKLADRFKKQGDYVVYMYTFGEGWEHLVELEDIVPRVANKEYPRILAGKRACPTEDVGGIDQYLTLCDVLKNPNHPEREEYMDWLEDYSLADYNPDKFHPREITFVRCPIYRGKSTVVDHINVY